MPIVVVSLQTEKEPAPRLRSGSLGFLWHVHSWSPVNVEAVRDQAGDDGLKTDSHPKLPLLNLPGLQTQGVKQALDFHVKSHLQFLTANLEKKWWWWAQQLNHAESDGHWWGGSVPSHPVTGHR